MDSTQNMEQSTANGEVSNNVDQLNSFDPKKFEERILNSVKEMLSDPRTTQSQKDKVMAEIKKDKGFKDFLSEYKAMRDSGLTDREIELEARLRDIETRPTVVDNPGRVVENSQAETVKIFAKALDLDLNDPEVVNTMMSGNVEESLRSMKSISDRRKNANPAVVSQSAGDSARQPDLLAEYKAKASNTRGSALIDLKMEYRKKGLDIT